MTGDEIKAARHALKMTQGEFAEAVGVGARAVQQWEAGTRNPRATAIKLIARLIEERQPKKDK